MDEIPASVIPGCMPIEAAVRYAASLAEVLRRMHNDGMVCGNLHPDRLRWDNHSAQLISNGDSAGDTAWLAPEQVRGEDPDARSNIFAFGAILYHWLSGCRPFPAEDAAELQRQILELTPAPIPAIPCWLASVLNRCLEKNPDLRWQRISSVLIELKLASASIRQARAAAAWNGELLSLRQQAATQDAVLSETRKSHECAVDELRSCFRQIDASVSAIQDAIANLQRRSQVNARTIEGLQVAASQTDEVVEDVVEAFGMMHKFNEGHGEGRDQRPSGE